MHYKTLRRESNCSATSCTFHKHIFLHCKRRPYQQGMSFCYVAKRPFIICLYVAAIAPLNGKLRLLFIAIAIHFNDTRTISNSNSPPTELSNNLHHHREKGRCPTGVVVCNCRRVIGFRNATRLATIYELLNSPSRPVAGNIRGQVRTMIFSGGGCTF